MYNKCKSLTVAALALLTITSVASAQVKPNDGSWKNSWTGYFWVPGYHGDAIFHGNPVHVSTSVSDTAKSLDKIAHSFNGHYEGKMMGYGFLVDATYWKMTESFSPSVTPTDSIAKSHANFSASSTGFAEIKPSQLILEFAGYGSIYQKNVADVSVTNVEAMVGGRYNHLRMQYQDPSANIDYSKSQNYIDPFIGVRVYQALAPQWGGNLRADIGGFDVGSKLSWQIVGTLGYHISPKNSVILGWRHYSQDYSTGSGADEFKWNVATSGPFLGFQSRF